MMPKEIAGSVARRLVADKQWWAVNHCTSNGNVGRCSPPESWICKRPSSSKAYQTQNPQNLHLNRTRLANALKCKSNVLIDGLIGQQFKVLEDGTIHDGNPELRIRVRS